MCGVEDQKKINQIVKESGTSFYWGMKILNKEKRFAMFTIYAFCRIVDDIADSEQNVEIKLSQLKNWKSKITKIYKDHSSDSITRKLLESKKKYGLKKEDFFSIIEGMRMDIIEEIRYPSKKKIDLYCSRVAGAVGCLSMNIFGIKSKLGRTYANLLGKAFQFTNILRDLKEDSVRNRCYIPLDIIKKFKKEKKSPQEIIKSLDIKLINKEMVRRTQKYYDDAEKISRKFKKKDLKAAILMKEFYYNIFKKISINNMNLYKKIKLSKIEKLIIIIRYFIRSKD